MLAVIPRDVVQDNFRRLFVRLLGAKPLVAAEFRDQRNHAGMDVDYQPVGFLALVVPAQYPAGAAGQIGYVRAPLIKDEVKVGATDPSAFGGLRRALRLLISRAMVPA